MKYIVNADLQGNTLTFNGIEANCAEDAIALVKRLEPVIKSVSPDIYQPSNLDASSIQEQRQENGLKKLIEDLGMQSPRFKIFVDSSLFFKPPVAATNQAANLEQISLQKLKRLHGWALVLMKALSFEDPLYNDIYILSNHVETVIKRLSINDTGASTKNTTEARQNG